MKDVLIQLLDGTNEGAGGPYFSVPIVPEIGDRIRHPRISGKVYKRRHVYNEESLFFIEVVLDTQVK